MTLLTILGPSHAIGERAFGQPRSSLRDRLTLTAAAKEVERCDHMCPTGISLAMM